MSAFVREAALVRGSFFLMVFQKAQMDVPELHQHKLRQCTVFSAVVMRFYIGEWVSDCLRGFIEQ
jgi:hypothetical protein